MTTFTRSTSVDNFIHLSNQYQEINKKYLESLKVATSESSPEKLLELLNKVEKNSQKLNTTRDLLRNQAYAYIEKHGSLKPLAQNLYPGDPSAQKRYIQITKIFLSM